ncbi:MAG TPA: glycosyltransferase [Polyangia bacterium]
MRILHLIDSLGGGGAERQLAYLAGGLVERGHEVHVLSLDGGPHRARLVEKGVVLHLGRLRPRLLLLGDLSRAIARVDPEVVQTWLELMNAVGGCAARLGRRPWIYSERNLPEKELGWRATVRHLIAGGADAVVANSESGARSWRTALGGARAKRVTVIPNALALDELDRAPPARPEALGLLPDAEVVLFAGRLVPQKNLALLAPALLRVLARRPRAVALVCGEGELEKWLKSELSRGGVADRCRFFGYRADLWSLMKLASVLVSTSRYEGRPNVVAEAMACGCPLALSDIPEHHELVPKDAALFFPDDETAAANAIAQILDDPAGAKRRAERAAERVRGHSIDRLAREYEAIYRAVLAARS